MKKIKVFICLLIISVLLVGCGTTNKSNTNTKKKNKIISIEDEVKDKMSKMTLEQKIAQMLILYSTSDTVSDDFKNTLKIYNPGGFILMKENITTFDKTKKFVDDLQKNSDIPMIISIDQEGGNVVFPLHIEKARVVNERERVFDHFWKQGHVVLQDDEHGENARKHHNVGKFFRNVIVLCGVNMRAEQHVKKEHAKAQADNVENTRAVDIHPRALWKQTADSRADADSQNAPKQLAEHNLFAVNHKVENQNRNKADAHRPQANEGVKRIIHFAQKFASEKEGKGGDQNILAKEQKDAFYEQDSFREIENNIYRYEIDQIVDGLKPREQQVIRERYGFNDGREKTLEEVGSMLGVTRERVRQIESKALKKLLPRMRAKDFTLWIITPFLKT